MASDKASLIRVWARYQWDQGSGKQKLEEIGKKGSALYWEARRASDNDSDKVTDKKIWKK